MSSVSKTLQILKYMGEPPYEFGVTELAEKIGIVKSGIHKILADLADAGFVVQNRKSRLYRLGPAVFRLGAVYGDIKGISEVSQNVLQTIVKATQRSALVGICEGDEAFLAYKLDAPGSFFYRGQVGRKFPFYAGALGKIFGAYMDQAHVMEAIERSGSFKTAVEKPDQSRLFEQFAKIREQGYALTVNENIDGAFGLSVPIIDARDHCMTACLCLAGPIELYDPEAVPDWLRLLREGASEISYKISRR